MKHKTKIDGLLTRTATIRTLMERHGVPESKASAWLAGGWLPGMTVVGKAGYRMVYNLADVDAFSPMKVPAELHTKDAAAYLEVTEKHVRALVKEGSLKSVREGRSGLLVFRRQDLDDYVERREVQPPEGYVSLKDAARMASISYSGLWRRVARGGLHSLTLKSTTFVRKADVLGRHARA